MSHHTLEDTFKIHKQLGGMHLAWSIAICPDKYGMFRTSNIATMDEVFLGDGLLHFGYQVSKITNQYYQQVLSGIKAEIEELKKKISSL